MKKAALTILASIVVPAVFFLSMFVVAWILTLLANIPVIGSIVLRFLLVEGTSASWFSVAVSIGIAVYVASLFEDSTKLKSGLIAGLIGAGAVLLLCGILLTIGGIYLSQSFWSIIMYIAIAGFGVFLIYGGAKA